MKGRPSRSIVGGMVLATGLAVVATMALRVEAAEPTGTTGGLGPPVVITAIKTVSGDFVDGGHIVYEVTLRNDGFVDSLDNVGPEFVDRFDDPHPFVSIEARPTLVGEVDTEWRDSLAIVYWSGSIAAGETVTIMIDAWLRPDASQWSWENIYGIGVVSNQGTVHVDSNADGTNDDTPVLTDDIEGGPVEDTKFTVTPLATTSTTTTANSTETTDTSAAVTATTLPRTGTPSTGTQALTAIALILIGGGLALVSIRFRDGTS